MNMTHRARGCPFVTNVDGEDFVIDGFAKYKGYGDECETIYFSGGGKEEEEGNRSNRPERITKRARKNYRR